MQSGADIGCEARRLASADSLIAASLDPYSFPVIEPRVYQIARELERILSIVELECGGTPVRVDGFRLRDLAMWADHQTDSALNALLPISGICNRRCRFCFEQGLPFARELSLMSVAEVRTRLKYYSPKTGRCLFPSNRPQMETFAHPEALSILEMARKREPGKLFCLTTNGSCLDGPAVERLAQLQPLMIKLSLNAVDADLNRSLMGTGDCVQVAIESPGRLREHRIPYIGGIVAWPTFSKEAMTRTVRYLEEHEAYAIRVRLPLTHKWQPERPDCDFDAHWRRVAAFAAELRDDCAVPLYVEPSAFAVTPVIPEVDGVILNSPAHRAGLRRGDVIQNINDHEVLTRSESGAVLEHYRDAGAPVEVVVRRGSRTIQLRLEEDGRSGDSYPYTRFVRYPGESFGILHVEDFRLRYVRDLFELIDRYAARRVLLFSSPIVAPLFEMLANGIPEFRARLQELTLHIETVPENTLGGNYAQLDSRFVNDYAKVIQRCLGRGAEFDLIVIPNAFGSAWGVDLLGESVGRLAATFAVPVELIDWLLVYGRDV